MAIYAYIYSAFPDRKERKYYVCNYRKGNAYTYQVVPQLQREFDRKGYEDKTQIGWNRFKKLRKHGHLYTSNRDHKRTPLYGEAEGLGAEHEWRFLAAWLGGEVWPGEIDWRRFGRRLRERLETGRPLPDALRALADHVLVSDGTTFADAYAELRRRHVDEVWFHLIDQYPAADLAVADGREWEGGGLGQEGEAEGGGERRHDRIRETRPTPPAVDEAELLARLGEVAGHAGPGDWSVLLEALGPTDDWYETVGAEADGQTRVPCETLYEIQWRLAERLHDLGLHHACAPAAEVAHPEPLHARFHVGAGQAVIVGLADYPPPVDRDELAEELGLQTHGGALDGWSEAGVEALARLLVDPQTGRPSPAAPTSEYVAELAAWEVDEAIRRGADEQLPDGARWNYSRLRDEIVLSAPAALEADALAAARDVVAEGLEARGWRGAAGETHLWRADDPLVLAGIEVPADVGGRLRMPDDRRSRVDQARDRARESDIDDHDRTVLMGAYRIRGQLTDRCDADPDYRREARALVSAVALSEFEEEAWAGWREGSGER